MFSGLRDVIVAMTASLSLLIPLLFSSSDAQEKSLTVLSESSKPVLIAVIVAHRVPYASLNELAPVLGFTAQDIPNARSLEFKNGSRRITFIAGNSFVLLNDGRSPKALTVQLPLPIYFSGNVWYAPVGVLAAMSETLFGVSGSYDIAANILHVGKPKPRFDIPSVAMETKVNGTLIRVVATRPIPQYEHFLKKDGWLYVTIPNVKADVNTINKLTPSAPVKKIVAIQSRQSLQLTFKLDDKILSTDISQHPFSHNLLNS